MSSAAESKPEIEEPTPKRVKLDGDEAIKPDVKSADNNNGITADEKAPPAESNNGTTPKSDGPASGSGGAANQIPVKAANGSNKEPKTNDPDASEGDDEDQEAFGDPNIADRLREVEAIQSQIIQLNEQASEEILLVEQKFNQLRRPHFEKRNAILKDVPNFWLAALANHPLISSMIQSAEDEDCLHYMVNVDVEELEDIKSGYNLKFYFAENPYIKNELIVRELRHLDNEEVVSETTPIEYKDTQEGKKLRAIVENSLAQYRRKVRDPSEMQGSFFAWLSQEQENGDAIAEIIKDQIWTSPVDFFLNNPEDYEDDDSGSDEDEEDYEDEEGIENDLEAGIPDEDELAELQEMEGEEFDDEEEDLDDDDEDEDGEDDE